MTPSFEALTEGYEEYEYIDSLISLNRWNKKYKFILINAKSNGKIPARYQDAYVSDSYDIVLIFCDKDQKPYEDYGTIKDKINKIHGVDNSADYITIFANPCTMQIILLHFDEVILTSHKKVENRIFIKSLTGIGSYSAKNEQRKRLFSQITIENYNDMAFRCSKLNKIDTEENSSNFSYFLECFSNDNVEWINNINSKLEE